MTMHALKEEGKASPSFASLQFAKCNMIPQRCHWQQHPAGVHAMHCRAQLCVSLSCKLKHLLCIQMMPGILCSLIGNQHIPSPRRNASICYNDAPIHTARSYITSVLTRCARHRQVQQLLQLLPPSICAALAFPAPAFSSGFQRWCQAKREAP